MIKDLGLGLSLAMIAWFVVVIAYAGLIGYLAITENRQPETKTECLENGSSVMEFGENALCSLNNDGKYYTVRNE